MDRSVSFGSSGINWFGLQRRRCFLIEQGNMELDRYSRSITNMCWYVSFETGLDKSIKN